ncbi:hypothetical protein AO282_06090 [Pseudomonas amygdali pv. morsprunorum]|nr:hypothetical protein AO282_06090 [Pseudomonas amygdali pv. morsprunorum]
MLQSRSPETIDRNRYRNTASVYYSQKATNELRRFATSQNNRLAWQQTSSQQSPAHLAYLPSKDTVSGGVDL